MRCIALFFLFIYGLITFLIAPLGVTFLCYKKRRDPPYGKRVWELLGFYNSPQLKDSDNTIWFHTVSVGEIIAARPLIKAFVKRNRHLKVIITTTTTTGAKEALKVDGTTHVFAPLDSPLGVFLFLRHYKPKQLFIMETELWPNLLNLSKAFGTKICVLNARMPERTCQKYEKYKGIVKHLIASKLDTVICQTKDDLERFERIGVNTEKLCISGSLKYDLHPNESLFKEARKIKKEHEKNEANLTVLGAISTHEGEEEQIIETFYSLKSSYPHLKLVLVPRHLSGVNRAQNFLDDIKGEYALRTKLDRSLKDFHGDILIGNTMGEMEFYLGLCDLIFMGGSLVDIGGHNPLEPAYFALPIITGPYYYNFTEQFDNLIENRAAYVAGDSRRLFSVCKMFFDDKELMITTGMQAIDIQQSGKGALKFTLNKLEEEINKL